MGQFEVEGAAAKADLDSLGSLLLMTNGNSFQKPVIDLQHLHSLGARYEVSYHSCFVLMSLSLHLLVLRSCLC